MKKLLLPILLLAFFNANSQVGINTPTPQKTLHVNGSLQVTNEINLGGNATTSGNAGTSGQVLTSNGPGATPTWQSSTNVVPGSNGSVIAVNGQLVVAQEINVQMSADFTTSTLVSIGNLDNEILDNESRYTGTSTSNSFTVSADGLYQVIINTQLATTVGTSPVVGIWDNTPDLPTNPNGQWIARVNDKAATDLQTYTLISAVQMYAGRTYSFRVSNTASTTIKAESSGSTGSGPITQMTVKRLK
ncbi:hypothetical protein [Chryseobacterium sp. IT-36CA2]|uniref:hypothetical protein n=1 Tax=Chryseobacterium sp. IT-36CA2 TaxID=3026460 RepID=UPI0039E1326C